MQKNYTNLTLLWYYNFKWVIRETGIGISEEFQKHIFENFSREETATVSGIQGTGLGLAITKKIVEMRYNSVREWRRDWQRIW